MKNSHRPQSNKLDYGSLEARKLLAAIDVFAAGVTGDEQIRLQVEGQTVATYDLDAGGANREFSTFRYNTAGDVSADDIRVEFFNDNVNPQPGNARTVVVDAIAIDGVRYETEADTVFSTGTWKAADGFEDGYRNSERLHTNGHLAFADSANEGSLVRVVARGSEGFERFQLKIDGQSVKEYEVDTATDSFGFHADGQVSADDVRVEFINAAWNAYLGIDTNLIVDKIFVDGVAYETEDSTVYSTGTWTPADGLEAGFKNREVLHTNGYFDFVDTPNEGSVVRINARGAEGFERFNLRIDGRFVEQFTASTSWDNFSWHANETISADQVQIEFVNSIWNPAAGIDTNLVVDNILIDGEVFETEDASVYSTGTWVAGSGVQPGFHQSEHLHDRGYFQYSSSDSKSTYQTLIDPAIGAVVTAFVDFDPQDPNDPWDILTNWNTATDELASIGVDEVTFGVFRNSTDGELWGGPAIETVRAAVAHAKQNGLHVTILPLFEADGWRGDYDPTGWRQDNFQTDYREFISDLAHIEGIDRFNIGTELNALVNNFDNHAYFADLISDVETAFVATGNTTGQIGYTSNFDAFDNAGHTALINMEGIDFLGVSAYFSLVDQADAAQFSGTGVVSDEAFDLLVENWNEELDRLADFGEAHDLPILLQEVGAVQQNYAAAAPFAVDPGEWVSSSLPDRFAADPLEQKAIFESLVTALDGRKDDFEGVHFWAWEHGSSRGERFYESVPADQPRYIEKFAIWPTDGGAGEFVADFVSTRV